MKIFDSGCPDNDASQCAELAAYASAYSDANTDGLDIVTRKGDGLIAAVIGTAPGLVALKHADGVMLVAADHYESAWEACS